MKLLEYFKEVMYSNNSVKVASKLPVKLKTIMFDNLGI
jgi:hypothetical protein